MNAPIVPDKYPELTIKSFVLNDKHTVAALNIVWKGRNLTITQKYGESKDAEAARKEMEKTLTKMVALAEVYDLGEKSKPTKKITYQETGPGHDHVTRERNVVAPKTESIKEYDDYFATKMPNKTKKREAETLSKETYSLEGVKIESAPESTSPPSSQSLFGRLKSALGGGTSAAAAKVSGAASGAVAIGGKAASGAAAAGGAAAGAVAATGGKVVSLAATAGAATLDATKTAGGEIATLAKKVGRVALGTAIGIPLYLGAVVASPFILIASGVAAVKNYFDKRKIKKEDHLVAAAHEMKETEEMSKLRAATTFYADQVKASEGISIEQYGLGSSGRDSANLSFMSFLTTNLVKRLDNLKNLVAHVDRALVRSGKSGGTGQEVKDVVEAIIRGQSTERFTSVLVENVTKELRKVQQTIGEYPFSDEAPPSPLVAGDVGLADAGSVRAGLDAADFKKRLNRFIKALGKYPEASEISQKDARNANEKILKTFREVLGSRAYHRLKYNIDDPAIKFLHKFAASIWTEVKVLDAYQRFGEKALDRARQQKALESAEKQEVGSTVMTSHDHANVVEAIDASIDAVQKDLYNVRRLPDLIMYTVTHPGQTLSSMMSEGGNLKTVASLLGQGEYDPALMSNNPSLQGTTEFQVNGQDVRVNNVYGGSPTIGDEISPEFLAILVAAENNQLAKPEDRIAEIPDHVIYTNFQNLDGGEGENSRSKAIMELNRLFPLSFIGITLSKDNHLYKMPEYKKDPASVKWTGPVDMGSEMLELLTRKSSFSLEDRGNKNEGSGFYFPGRIEHWNPIFDAVIKQAVWIFSTLHGEQSAEEANKLRVGEEAYKLRGAFQEYVYASLQHLLEVQMAQELIERGVKNPHIHSQRACKENIDRGGAANAAYLHLRLGLIDDSEKSQEEKQQVVVGALHSRSLAVRNRMVLLDRLPQVKAFMEYVPPQDFWKGQKWVLEQLKSPEGNSLQFNSPKFTLGAHATSLPVSSTDLEPKRSAVEVKIEHRPASALDSIELTDI